MFSEKVADAPSGAGRSITQDQGTQTAIGGVTSAPVYNGDGLRMKHTVGVTKGTTGLGLTYAGNAVYILRDTKAAAPYFLAGKLFSGAECAQELLQ